MILKLTDKKEFSLTDEQAQQVQSAIARNKEFIMLPDGLIKTKMILSLLPEPDQKEHHQLGGTAPSKPSPQAVPGCKGKRSINFEIHQLIKQKYPKEWPTKVADKACRERLRLWLHDTQGGVWCDFIEKTCACTSDYQPTPHRALEMFPNAKQVEVPEL